MPEILVPFQSRRCQILEDLSGRRVRGVRPGVSNTDAAVWALDVLAETASRAA